MTLLEHMERLVYATRLDRLLFRTTRSHSFRWLPLLVIAALILGFALMAKAGMVSIGDFLVGWSIFYGAILAAALLRVLGPRFTGTADQPLDERELMVKARAHAISGAVLALVVSLGCFYMASVGIPWLWHPQLMDWLNLGFGIQGVSTLLPTWFASWIQPRPGADFDD